MKILTIINKNSGMNNISGNEFTPGNIESTFKGLNIENEIIQIKGDDIARVIKSKLNSGIDALIAAGGDGTVSTAASCLIESNSHLPLAVLPAGTLNHFAKDLKLPLNLKESAEVISKGKISKIDAGEVNGKIFINNSSIGFYPKVVKKRIQSQKLGVSKWTAMGNAILNAFNKLPLLEVIVETDKEKINCKTPFVFIGNNEYNFDILKLGTRDMLDQGFLSLYYPNNSGKYSMFRFAFLALINKLHQPKDFSIVFTKQASLNINKSRIEAALDGELFTFTPPLNYKIIPKCLNVLVP